MVDLIKKTDRQYKTKPRFHERRATDRGLCVWQLNKMLRGTGYKIERTGKQSGIMELLLVPTGYKDVEIVSPFTGCFYVRHYSLSKGNDSISFWNRVINRMLEGRNRSRAWITEEFKHRMQPYYRTWNNRPDIHGARKRAEQLWKIHYGKAKHLQS